MFDMQMAWRDFLRLVLLVGALRVYATNNKYLNAQYGRSEEWWGGIPTQVCHVQYLEKRLPSTYDFTLWAIFSVTLLQT